MWIFSEKTEEKRIRKEPMDQHESAIVVLPNRKMSILARKLERPGVNPACREASSATLVSI
jgi:hypothetical protein